MRGIVSLAEQPRRRRRGLAGQRRLRRCERQVRRAGVACARCWIRHGHSLREAATELHVHPRTLRRWHRGWHAHRLKILPRGRPPSLSDAPTRAAVLTVLHLEGPKTGLPTLRARFPHVAKRELEELQRRYREAFHRNRRLHLHALRWHRVGSVWAMDFAEPPARINGVYDQLLCVRDVPSTRQLWALPTLGKSSKTVVDSLDALVGWHGAPLVLKIDNDGVFRARDVHEWAGHHGVLLLYSPPYYPQYNGSVECGIGSLKVAAHYISALNDRPGQWTADDIHAAVQQINTNGRPRGAHGPSPIELWDARGAIDEQERQQFNDTVLDRFGEQCARWALDPDVELPHHARAPLERKAIEQALHKLGYLSFRRRRITLPIRKWKADIISQ
jgi:transposase